MNPGDFLTQQLQDAGLTVNKTAAEVREYFRQRAQHLTSLAGDPDFAIALAAETTNMLEFAAEETIGAGDQTDSKAWNVVFGLLGGVALA